MEFLIKIEKKFDEKMKKIFIKLYEWIGYLLKLEKINEKYRQL